MVITLDITDKISVCPFCGCNPLRFRGVENNKYWIFCNNNDCEIQPETSMYRIKGNEIRAWNKGKFSPRD